MTTSTQEQTNTPIQIDASAEILNTEIKQKRVRLDFLDGVRGLAALYVVIHHAYMQVSWWQALPAAHLRSHVSGHLGPLPRHLLLLLHPLIFGQVAVDIFIVLSGFCLMLPIAEQKDFAMKGGVWNYILRRARRILPPYYAALLLSLAIIYFIPGMNTHEDARWAIVLPAFQKNVLLSHLFLLHDMRPEWAGKIDYPMWSIPVEWHIYFLFPLLLLPALRRFGLIAALVVGIGFGHLVGVLSQHNLPLHLDPDAPWLFGLFAMGMAAAVAVFSPEYSKLKLVKCLSNGWVAGALFLIWAIKADHWLASGPKGDWLVGAWCACLLIYCAWRLVHKAELNRTKLLSFFESKPVVGLGIFSYSLYLVHAPILGMLFDLAMHLHMSSIEALGLELLAGVPLSLLIAYGFHLLFERPFMHIPKLHAKAS